MRLTLQFWLCGLLLLATFNSFAQEKTPYRTCGSHDAVFDYLKKNYDLGTLKYQVGEVQREGTDYTVPTVNTDTTYTIPVVVHVVYLADNKYENVSDEIIFSQIEALNRDFNLLNEDVTKVRDEFKQFIGNAKVKFELAKVDPQGRATTGITRKKGAPVLLPDWNPVFDNVKNTAQGGRSPWKTSQYLNIWVADLNINSRTCKTCVDVCDTCGLLGGYAHPPKGLPNWVIDIGTGPIDASAAYGPSTDGVVIDFRFFGQYNEFNKDYLNGNPAYGEGRTTVHEVGHYLGLRHTWGDYGTLLGDGCQFDDGIADTPNEFGPYANSATPGDRCGATPNTCPTPFPGDGVDYADNFENYMDYSSDVCYAMFTIEQVNMMRYALTAKRPNLIIGREIVSETTGIKNLSASSNGISIFPNPSRGVFNIRRDNATKDETIVQVYNLMGASISSYRIPAGSTTYTINLSQLPPAVYFVNFRNGDISTTESVIIQ
jgi:hypothetical protein